MRHWIIGVVTALSVGLLSLGTPHPAQAITIAFEATDLPDTSPGDDLWQYTYLVNDFLPQANLAFETLFAAVLYSDLQDPPPGVADWDILTFQPDPNFPDPGRYSALALIDGASLTGPFTVSFVWLGGLGSTPGVQPFELNEFDDQGLFVQTLATGLTQPAGSTTPIPEPGTAVLVGTGLVSLAVLRNLRLFS